MRRFVFLAVGLCPIAGMMAQSDRAAGDSPGAPLHLMDLDGRIVAYEVRGGYAFTQSDIVLGTAAEMEEASKGAANRARDAALSIFGSGLPSLWTNATIPYIIDSDVPDPSRILNAIAHWNTHTPLRVVPRAGEVNYVRFQRWTTDAVCASYVGMRGSEQIVFVTDYCDAPSLIHEIGHAFGLEHEQQRSDRNAYVTVQYENIDRRYIRFFDQDTFRSLPGGYYDYDSIMHYNAWSYSINGRAAIETVPVGIPLDQPPRLSPGDIDGISRRYGFAPRSTTITTIPSGLPVVVDGVAATSPQSFDWAPGSRHSVAVTGEFGVDPLYRFVRWSDSGALRHDITATSDQTVFAATFQRLHQVSVGVASGSGTATLAPLGSGLYPERLPVRITATPAANSTFLTWSVGKPLNSGLGFSAPLRNGMAPPANAEFLATFVTSPVTTIDSEPSGLMISVDGTLTLTPAKFQWSPGSEHTLSVETTTQVRFGDATQYRHIAWSDGGAVSHKVTANANSATYTARFMPRYLLTLQTPGTAGTISVSPTSADGFYDAGTVLELRANVTSGGFRYWKDDLSGGGLTRTLKMDSAHVVTAYFGTPYVFTPYNAASFQVHPGPNLANPGLAPGEIVTIFSGDPIGPANLVSAQVVSGKVTTTLGDTRVLFDGVAAPLIYVAQNQLSAVVPASVAGRTQSTLRIERNGQLGTSQAFNIVDTFPSLFTANSSGTGQVAAFNEDGSVNTADHGTAPGSVIVLYATGAGVWESSVPDGQVMGSTLVHPRAPVYLRIGGLPAQVLYAGSAPDLVNGVLQVNAIVPAEALTDPSASIQLIVGNYSSPPGTTISVK